MDRKYDLLELLDHLDPADTSYEEWTEIGMALKEEGYSADDWDRWSRKEAGPRYTPGNCEKKWASFNDRGITGGTLVEIVRRHGYDPGAGHALEWDDYISVDPILDPAYVENVELKPHFDTFDPVQEVRTYLDALFLPDDYIGYTIDTFQDESGKWRPKNGAYDRTKAELIRILDKHGELEAVFGDYNQEAGAWIRFNPLDGRGQKNENITDYRYALIESDDMALERQMGMIRELKLPVAIIVYSGGKSVHAIVHIDAGSLEEYKARVQYLYDVCKKNEFIVDTQNKNPSRLSRMPGVYRKGKKQYIVSVGSEFGSFREWQEWYEDRTDEMPEMENLSDVWDNMPDLAPALIDGVLRQGHKMLISGPSKAGKTFAMINLCISIAEGVPWMGWKCSQGRVVYVNLEVDRASCLHRFRDVYKARELKPDHLDDIMIWNLRGKAAPMDKLVRPLIRRLRDKPPIAVIVDPLYKVITGDENSASDMAGFFNQFDKICTELECATIYSHHHSKGLQTQKASMDRASGSGVFARDPDALIDMIQLNNVDEDAQRDGAAMFGFDDDPVRVGRLTGWRLETVLREFPDKQTRCVWFDWPIHRADVGGILEDTTADRPKDQKKKTVPERLPEAYDTLYKFENRYPTVEELAEYLEVGKRSVQGAVKQSDEFEYGSKTLIDGKKISIVKRK